MNQTEVPAYRPKITAAERVRRMTNMAELYRQGYSIRQIAKWAGVSYTSAHYYLTKARVEFRSRGQRAPMREKQL